MYLRNCWYACAWAEELGRVPLSRILLNEPVLLFRALNGKPIALEDRCCHRSLPLSMGKIIDDTVQCAYHGLTFDLEGNCVRIPGQKQIPPEARVRSYPLAEKWKLIWIWMGDPALADEDRIPNWWYLDHPDWRTITGNYLQINCNYQLMTDNLVDLSHVSFVHETTIGHSSVAEAPVKMSRDGERVRTVRWILNCDPAPFHTKVAGITEKVDRWQISETQLPSLTLLDVGVAPAGTGAPEGNRDQAIEFRTLNAVTPETSCSSHYFFAHPRKFGLDNAEVDEVFGPGFKEVFNEDRVVLEAQQRALNHNPQLSRIDIRADSAGLTIRRLLADAIAEERQRAEERGDVEATA